MEGVFYINGEFVDVDRALLPAQDLAVMRGYGVFDFLRTYNGNPFCLDDHVRRLLSSARLIGISPEQSGEEIMDLTRRAMEKRDFGEANIRLIITGGPSEDGIFPDGKPRLLIFVTPLRRMPENWYTDGVGIITYPLDRHMPEAKTLNYIPAIMALQKARAQNAIEAIYTSCGGRVLEGTTSNLFLVIQNRLITPGDGILMGITRKAVLKAIGDKWEVAFQNISLRDLENADEVFLTSSNKEVAPVVRVNGKDVGNGKIGPVAKDIMGLWRKYTAAC